MQIMFVWSLQWIILSVSKEHSDEYENLSEEDGTIVEARDDGDDGEIGMTVEARDEWDTVSMAQVQSTVGVLKNNSSASIIYSLHWRCPTRLGEINMLSFKTF